MKTINKSIYQPIMNENNMENEKTPLYVAFSTQKGGVAKPPLPCWRRVTSITSKATMWRWSIATTPNTPLPGCESGMPNRSERMKTTSTWRMNSSPGWGRKPTRYCAVRPKRRLQRLTNI